MSHTGTKAFIDACNEQGHALATQIRWHLGNNHYPPINPVFDEIAIDAINLAKADEWAEIIELPNGKKLTVAAIVNELHLDAFL